MHTLDAHRALTPCAPCMHTVTLHLYSAVDLWPPHALRPIAMCITATQVAQMVAGLLLTVAAAARGPSCAFSPLSCVTSVLGYTSYLLLFIRFADGAYGLKLRLRRTKRALGAKWAGKNVADAEVELLGAPWRKDGLALREQFQAACEALPLYLGSLEPQEMMELYGMYKQVTCGEAPSRGDGTDGDASNGAPITSTDHVHGNGNGSGSQGAVGGVARSEMKLLAWRRQSGRESDKCMQAYVRLLNEVAMRHTRLSSSARPVCCGALLAAPTPVTTRRPHSRHPSPQPNSLPSPSSSIPLDPHPPTAGAADDGCGRVHHAVWDAL